MAATTTCAGRWGHVWLSGKTKNTRKHHLAHMWLWFNAGLRPVAALMHTVCVSHSVFVLSSVRQILLQLYRFLCSLLGWGLNTFVGWYRCLKLNLPPLMLVPSFHFWFVFQAILFSKRFLRIIHTIVGHKDKGSLRLSSSSQVSQGDTIKPWEKTLSHNPQMTLGVRRLL